MNNLEKLFKEYKNRPYKSIKYNAIEYLNYSDAVCKEKPLLDINKFTEGNKVHYMTGTMIGSFMYNAIVYKVTGNEIYIQPCGKAWKGKALKYNNGDQVYIAKGWL